MKGEKKERRTHHIIEVVFFVFREFLFLLVRVIRVHELDLLPEA
jgi:hypothetical protein